MANENWQQIRKIFDDALRLNPEERQRFIKEACGENKTLLGEVESLLSALDGADSFLETPAVAKVAEVIEPETIKLERGTRFAHYEIIRQIGAGGMGEVYLAKDKKLDRQVAVKVLNEKFARHESNLGRFTREAKAASALNHPNILVIHEIGESENSHYIVSEYVEGKTLRETLRESRLKLSEIFDIAIQIAGALTAAHKAHLVHRDIKPENIMIRDDGFVKVLDFGLAKLIEEKNKSFIGLDTSTLKQNETAKGVILGTVNYMSPEQAKGERIDERTDIFSLGVVIYEMISGKTPFAADSLSETIANLLNREPQPLSNFAAEIPAELQHIVLIMLRKDKDERYQTMKDLSADLKRLQNRLRFEGELERSQNPEAEKQTEKLNVTTGEAKDLTRRLSKERTDESKLTRTNQTVKSKSKNRAFVAGGLILVVVLAVASFGLYSFLNQFQTQPQTELKMTLITNHGKADKAVISPDGKYVAYTQTEGGKLSVRVKQVEASSEIQIVPPANLLYGMTFSPDSNYVYYVKPDDNDKAGIGILYRISVLGGVPEKLLTDTESAVGFSPDGKQIAFIRNILNQNEAAIMIANADGTNEWRLAGRNFPNDLNFHPDTKRYFAPAWSPDGKIIACTVNNEVEGEFYQSIIGFRIEDGGEIPISSKRWRYTGRMEWITDNSGLMFSAADVDVNPNLMQIWKISYPGGGSQQITNDTNLYWDVSLTADSKMLVTTRFDSIYKIWIAPNGDYRVRQISSGKYDGENLFDWTPDGQIIFTTTGSKRGEFWMMRWDGSERKQLAGHGAYPEVSSDGRFLVFWTMYADGSGLKRMNIASGEIKQLTDKNYDHVLSPDGRWVIYSVKLIGKTGLFKMPIEGGDPIHLISKNDASPLGVSLDGKFIAYYYREGDPYSGWKQKIGLIPFEGGEEFKTLQAPESSCWFKLGQDLRSIEYCKTIDGVSNIWSQPFDGGKAKQVTDFKSEKFYYFDWSPDGKNLALLQNERIIDVVLIRDFK